MTLAVGLACFAYETLADELPVDDSSRGDALVSEYFQRQTDMISQASLADVQSLEDWTSRRGEYRRQLLEMLGLDPLPPRTPLQAVVTGTLDTDEFVVERLHFQSMPGLYVTGNLYRPKNATSKLPAILYGCGHAKVKEGGVSLGNKTHYQHHGAYFAKNGFVCLVIDTIQLGEIEGTHHGTYSQKRWWWNHHGYTPAGVEAWNCVRAIDYLESRPEVDSERIGMTGRSGGGAYSWWTAAIDERVKAVVPVAGITSLKNHVVDGCVEGHCDCMYMVNAYQWDFPMVAALIAPRPLLISNTDTDRIFPLDGVIDVHRKTRHIYQLYGAADQLGLNITPGDHEDTHELRVSAFEWLNRFLNDDHELSTNTAKPFTTKSNLKVFDAIPDDERVTTIDESFTPVVSGESLPLTQEAFDQAKGSWKKSLDEKVFRAWPEQGSSEPLETEILSESRHDGRLVRMIQYNSQSPYQLQLYLVSDVDSPEVAVRAPIKVNVLDQADWEHVASGLASVFPDRFPRLTADAAEWKKILHDTQLTTVAYVFPRGVGPTRWTQDARENTQIRRRFMLLGQTQASMQIYDVRRSLQCLSSIKDLRGARWILVAQGDAAMWTLYASLYEPEIHGLRLAGLPTRNRDAPDLLMTSRYVEMPHVVLLAAERIHDLVLTDGEGSDSSWRDVLQQSAAAKNVLFE